MKRYCALMLATSTFVALITTTPAARANRWNWQSTLYQGMNAARQLKNVAGQHGGRMNNGESGSQQQPQQQAPAEPPPAESVHGEVQQHQSVPENMPAPSQPQAPVTPPSQPYHESSIQPHANPAPVHQGGRRAFHSGYDPAPTAVERVQPMSVSHLRQPVVHKLARQSVAVVEPPHGKQQESRPVNLQNPEVARVPVSVNKPSVETSWCMQVMRKTAAQLNSKKSSST